LINVLLGVGLVGSFVFLAWIVLTAPPRDTTQKDLPRSEACGKRAKIPRYEVFYETAPIVEDGLQVEPLQIETPIRKQAALECILWKVAVRDVTIVDFCHTNKACWEERYGARGFYARTRAGARYLEATRNIDAKAETPYIQYEKP
jgi:hypothetical protein